MFGLGPQELFVILIIVVVLFGGRRLPEIGRALGKSLREFKKASGGEKDVISAWAGKELDKEASARGTENNAVEKGSLQEKMEQIPGIKEAQDIKETANKIKAASKFFIKK
jgi:sec-independent protein translocase protein TatA